MRTLILENTQIEELKTFGDRVFSEAQVESVVLTLKKDLYSNDHVIKVESEAEVKHIRQSRFIDSPDKRFNINISIESDYLVDRLKEITIPLGDLTDICIGIQLGGSSGSESKDNFISSRKEDDTYQKVLDGKDINRYYVGKVEKFVKYGNWLHRKRDVKYFINPKILIRQIGQVPIATYDENHYYTLNTLYNLIAKDGFYSLTYFLAIINSRLGAWLWRKTNSDFKTIFPKIKKSQIQSILIYPINFDEPTDKNRHDRIVFLVGQLMSLKTNLDDLSELSDKRHELAERIAYLDHRIDTLVYELYGLTEDEIRIVEGS